MRYTDRVRIIADSLTADLPAEETIVRFVCNMKISLRFVDEWPCGPDGSPAEGINSTFGGVTVASDVCLERHGIERDAKWRIIFHELAHQTGVFFEGRDRYTGGMEEMIAETAAYALTMKFGLPAGDVQ